MTSLSDLREVVDVVIGVATHVHTHTHRQPSTRLLVASRRDRRGRDRRGLRPTGGVGRRTSHAEGLGQSKAPAAMEPASPDTWPSCRRSWSSSTDPNEPSGATTTTVIALLPLARRFRALSIEAKEREKAIKAIVRAWRPDPLEEFDAGAIVAATVLCAWSHPGRIHSEAAFAMLAGVAPIPANSDKSSTAIDSTATATASSTGRCTPSSSHGSAVTARPGTMWPAAPPNARPAARSNAACPATSPATSIAYSKAAHHGLTNHRSVAASAPRSRQMEFRLCHTIPVAVQGGDCSMSQQTTHSPSRPSM